MGRKSKKTLEAEAAALAEKEAQEAQEKLEAEAKALAEKEAQEKLEAENEVKPLDEENTEKETEKLVVTKTRLTQSEMRKLGYI